MNITHTKKIVPMKQVLGFALMLSGFAILLFNNLFFGLMLFVMGISLNTTEGSEINLAEKRYRTIRSVLGIRLGNWKPLPEFEYLSVFKTTENNAISAYGAEISRFKSDIIVLNAFYNRNKHITFYKTEDKVDAFRVAGHFRLALGIDILDATEAEHHWL